MTTVELFEVERYKISQIILLLSSQTGTVKNISNNSTVVITNWLTVTKYVKMTTVELFEIFCNGQPVRDDNSRII
jgi:hypothetical protein